MAPVGAGSGASGGSWLVAAASRAPTRQENPASLLGGARAVFRSPVQSRWPLCPLSALSRSRARAGWVGRARWCGSGLLGGGAGRRFVGDEPCRRVQPWCAYRSQKSQAHKLLSSKTIMLFLANYFLLDRDVADPGFPDFWTRPKLF